MLILHLHQVLLHHCRTRGIRLGLLLHRKEGIRYCIVRNHALRLATSTTYLLIHTRIRLGCTYGDTDGKFLLLGVFCLTST